MVYLSEILTTAITEPRKNNTGFWYAIAVGPADENRRTRFNAYFPIFREKAILLHMTRPKELVVKQDTYNILSFLQNRKIPELELPADFKTAQTARVVWPEMKKYRSHRNFKSLREQHGSPRHLQVHGSIWSIQQQDCITSKTAGLIEYNQHMKISEQTAPRIDVSHRIYAQTLPYFKTKSRYDAITKLKRVPHSIEQTILSRHS